MTRSIIIIFTVALLGGAGVYAESHNNQAAANTTTSNTVSSAPVSTTSSPSPNPTTPSSTAYKDGTYTGSASRNEYGTVQISVAVSGGKITDVNFLKMPSGGHSSDVTDYAKPLLKQSTLDAQSANIDFVSGATTTSVSFEKSLQSALDQAVI